VNVEALLRRLMPDTLYVRSRLHRGPEEDKASAFWSGLSDYHLTNDGDPVAIGRSKWLAEDVVPGLGLRSLLEVGTNSGRNLQYIRAANPTIELKGIDVNARAIEFARSKGLDIEFAVADANRWLEPADRWDGVLTMSLLDHIPDDAAERLAVNIAASVTHVVSVELWDGSHGTRGPYKYSRDTRSLFERQGLTTLRWEKAPGQYDEDKSLLWCYIGRRSS
jgi:SAM-dependent methyltransferase